ncbi:MAG: alpha/beta hydrolase family protein [Clostridium sp.]|nr:alpha/beta hydrolase family protein [Acetatifactor muris]MCM1527532.1 alpha/beta hydrolase family protein [Bacteroides sp.]MCM1563774.1 alpha/beta hydrolase family protein [Clostridium sp.]
MDSAERIIEIPKFYGSLQGMLKKFDRYARQDAFRGEGLAEFETWKKRTRDTLRELLGMKYMENCSLDARLEETVTLDGGIVREKVLIQVEPDTWMPMYILIPPYTGEGKRQCFLALPGHQGAGKYSVAGCYEIPAVMDKIKFFNYDYGMQLARRGYVALCPDCRGFGERRDEYMQTPGDETAFLRSSCFQLAHMAEPMGETVAGMCTWDAMRLIDYVYERGEWDTDTLGVVGFSGGGMQALWLAALDERVRQCIISGYLYGYKDSLMILNNNCNCNYVPHLWEHYDMGDIASLIAPRPVAFQSCRADHLNGPRGLDNVYEQIEIVRAAYDLYGVKAYPIHDIREGGHCWHEEVLDEALPVLRDGVEHYG